MPNLLSPDQMTALATNPTPMPAVAGPLSAPAAPASSTSPLDFNHVMDVTSSEADKYTKAAQKQYAKAKRWETVSGILNLVGGLASSANQIYQATQGRQALPIGTPLQQIGGGVQGLLADPAKLAYQQNADKAAVYQIPNLDPTMRQGLLSSIDAGQKEAGFKGLFESMKAENRPPNLGVVYSTGRWPDGRMATPQELKQIEEYQSLGRTNITISPEATNRAGYMKSRALEIQKQLNDPFSNVNIVKTPDAAAQRESLQQELSQIQTELNLPTPGQSSKPNGLGKKSSKAAAPQAATPPQGAVGTAKGNDGKMYYIDANKKVIGAVQ